MSDEQELTLARERMVNDQLIPRGVKDERVLHAMSTTPRHHFLPPSSWSLAYADHPVSIGSKQTISQPYIVAWMSELLAHLPKGSKILEIGTGCGYQTAILVALGYEVYSIERIASLSRMAEKNLRQIDSLPTGLYVSDGRLGHLPNAPYDAIISAACARKIPRDWIEQLIEGGLIILPIGKRGKQYLVRCIKRGRKLVKEEMGLVRFVPLLSGNIE